MYIKNCKYLDCGKPSATRGWCYGHYGRWLKYGDPSITVNSTKDNIKICSVNKCNSQVRSKGYCQKHYYRNLYYGDALAKPNKYEAIGELRNTPTHNTYRGMLERCKNKNHTAYKYYGGRGITVCDRWKSSFLNFYKDMGKRPKGCSLDRLDNSKGYSPENCTWSTTYQQNTNKRNTIRVLFNSELVPLRRLAKISGVEYSAVKSRYLDLGWSLDESLKNINKTIKFNKEDISDMMMFRKAGMMFKDIARAYGTDGRYVSQLIKKESCK